MNGEQPLSSPRSAKNTLTRKHFPKHQEQKQLKLFKKNIYQIKIGSMLFRLNMVDMAMEEENRMSSINRRTNISAKKASKLFLKLCALYKKQKSLKRQVAQIRLYKKTRPNRPSGPIC